MSAIVTCAATLLRASYGEPAELDDATADDWRRIAYEARVQGDAIRADLSAAQAECRLLEAERDAALTSFAEGAAARRELEATCTGLRGERDAARTLLFRSEDAAGVWERAADAARADLARVTAERDELHAMFQRTHNVHHSWVAQVERGRAAIAAADALADRAKDASSMLLARGMAAHLDSAIAAYRAARGSR